MSDHTKGPWRIGRFTGPASYEEVRETVGNMDVVVDTDTGPYVLAACNINFPEDAKANARRIVACVNACAGIDTETLEVTHGLDAIYNHIQKQRDVMRAALNLIADGEVMDGEFTHADTILAYQQIARAAIEKAEKHLAQNADFV